MIESIGNMIIGENMNDADMIKKQMLDELMLQRKRIAELEVEVLNSNLKNSIGPMLI